MGRETNKQRREKQATSAREKAAVARAAQARVDQRRRAKVILGSVVGAAVVIALIAIIAITSGGKSSPNDATLATSAIVNGVTQVDPATYNSVGQGSANLDAVKAINDTPLTKGGKPEVFGVFAEFCPFCAAERWALVNALSRFGTFSNLHTIRSAVTDGDLATFTFHQASYTSKYLSFVPVEDEDRNRNALENPTKDEQAIWSKYTGLSFPFVDYGGKYVQTQVGFQDEDLSGLTWTQIVAELKDPTSTLAKDILGEANIDTALICKLTNDQPSDVCSASGLSAINLPTTSA